MTDGAPAVREQSSGQPDGSRSGADSSPSPQHPAGEPLAGKIRSAIVSGDLAPGQRLIEIDLMSRYGTARAAVRQALTQLQVERVVESRVHYGARVRSITSAEAAEIIEVLASVQPLITGIAAHTADDADIQNLARASDRLSFAMRTTDRASIARAAWGLQRAVTRATRRQTLIGLVDNLTAVLACWRVSGPCAPAHSGLRAHIDFVDALMHRDAQTAASIAPRALAALHSALR